MLATGTLAGKVAIVTGGGRGVGRGIALALAGEGAAVAINGRTEGVLRDTVAEIEQRGGRALAIPGDITDPVSIADLVARTVDELGAVDILVNNAQASHGLGTLLDVDDATFLGGFVAGPLATFRMMKACHPHLIGGGVIVNFGTGASLRPDPVGLGCYSAVKEATGALTRAAASEWGSQGIRVHTIVPLANSEALTEWAAARPEESAAFFATIPLRRLGDSEQDIGRAVVFLCGPDSAYMTGNTICVDGGQAFLR